MGLLSQNTNDINNELSAVLRVIRTHYRNEIKLQIMNASCIQEFKLKILRKTFGYYKFLFLIKIPEQYPFEPLWAEPVIVSREMNIQFYHHNFKYYKLRPLIDSLLIFCHKYDTQNMQALQISFPITKFYGDKDVTAKVLILLHKALSKFSSRFAIDIPGHRYSKSPIHYHTHHSNDFYNDMGVNMYEYINMLNTLSPNPKKDQKYFTQKRSYEKSPKKEMNSTKTELLAVRSNEINRHLKRTLYKNFTRKSFNKYYGDYMRDLHYCKPNLCKMKGIVNPLSAILKPLTELGFLEEFFFEIEDSFRININLFNYVFTMRHNMPPEFVNIVGKSLTFSEEEPYQIKIIGESNPDDYAVVAMHSREIIPMNTKIGDLIKFILSLTSPEKEDLNLYLQDNFRSNQNLFKLFNSFLNFLFNKPEHLHVSSWYSGYLTEDSVEYMTNVHYISHIITVQENLNHRGSSVLHIYEEPVNFQQTFLKDREALKLMITNKLSLNEPARSKLCMLYSEIISEVIQYHSPEASLFEYTLQLNPRSPKHISFLDSIGLLKHRHYSHFEILAPKDFNIRLFFIKEIFNPNGRGVVIKLHKLSPENVFYKLILDENSYFTSLSDANKHVWCNGVTSNTNFNLVKLLFNLGRLYIGKLERNKLMKTEANTLKVSNLSIHRYHFPPEIIESLSIFDKNL